MNLGGNHMRKALTLAAILAASVSTSALAGSHSVTVGVSWSNFQEERWKTDEAAIKAALEAAGATYISADAQASASKQLTDIEALIAQGADALIILAMDKDAIAPAIDQAAAEEIPVVGYDRLIEDARAFYLTFDNKGVGRIIAETVQGVQGPGNYAIIKGDPGDPNAQFLLDGMMEVIGDEVADGSIKIVGEAFSDGWKPENAQKNMEQILTANNNMVDAVLAENDGMAGGVIAALAAQGLTIPVGGQDGDLAALNRVARGTQTVSVWKNSRDLGKAAADIAVALAGGTMLSDVDGAVKWSGGANGVEMNAIFLDPTPITADTLNLVIDAGHISKEQACEGARPTVAACQ
jgi:D-xylose transport system substrate-binding protein